MSRMTDRERFLAVARFEKPDYMPIFGFFGAPGMSRGCLLHTHRSLVSQGMPASVGGCYVDWECRDVESWYRYWGTTGPISIDFGIGLGARGIQTTTRVEDGFEIVESESGELIRQVVDNANTYSMPEFVRYAVRDRASWAFWRDRMTPSARMPADELEARCRRYDDRTQVLAIGVSGAYGFLRCLMGPEAASMAFYDHPELVHDMMRWRTEITRLYTLPLIERLKPEAVYMGEDLCYNHGMLLSPRHFDEFCGPYYRMVCDCARAAGVPVMAVDSDGNIMEFVDVASRYGLNAIFPCEVKAGNDLFALRQKHPRMLLFGWLEKEAANEGNEGLIAREITGKVPPLMAQGGYFPNGDHGIQPLVTFQNLCRFMTVLHEVCGNPEGEFPRVPA